MCTNYMLEVKPKEEIDCIINDLIDTNEVLENICIDLSYPTKDITIPGNQGVICKLTGIIESIKELSKDIENRNYGLYNVIEKELIEIGISLVVIEDGVFKHLKHIGYITAEKFDEEYCFNLCNWSNWSNTKPKNLHADICNCGSGILFHHPAEDRYWLSKSQGWYVGTLDECIEYIKANAGKPFWE